MSDYLQRQDAPLSAEEWERLDCIVEETAKRHLVGRRFISVFGPFGVGLQTIHHDAFCGSSDTCVNMTGECDETPLGAGQREYKRLPIFHKDFQIHWRDIETARQFQMPVDCSLAAAAAAFVAHAEDDMVFNGRPELGIDGLLTVKNRKQVTRGDWSEPGTAFADVVKAAELLSEDGFYGPYVLVVSPQLYAQTNRVYANTGVLEIEQITKIASEGVFQSAIVPQDKAIFVAVGPQNMDLAISQDMVTAYRDTDNLNHVFRVMEIVTLRIKRAGSICSFE